MKNQKVDLRTIILGFLTYALCIILVGLLWEKSIILTTCLIILSIMGLVFYHSGEDLFAYFAAFVLGPLGEIIAIQFGAWSFMLSHYILYLRGFLFYGENSRLNYD